jgi:UDP-N-acetylmuramate--alanine ligase
VHVVGVGGIGMSAIAEILHAKGYTVQGSDQKDSANVRRLRAKGIRVFVGHDPVNLVGARYIVISTAVKPATRSSTQRVPRVCPSSAAPRCWPS